MNLAVCTLVIGKRYEQLFYDCAFPSWESYCQRHGYALKVFQRPLADLPGKSFAWQKLFVLDQQEVRNFDRILWVDSDIFIKSGSPPVEAPQGRIGYVPDFLAERNADHWYQQFGLSSAREVVQTGVLLLEPEHQRILHEVIHFPETYIYEMPALSLSVSKSNLGYRLDPRFNAVTTNLLLDYAPAWMLENKPVKELLWILRYRPLREGLEKICKANWFLHAAGAKRDLIKIAGIVAALEKANS